MSVDESRFAAAADDLLNRIADSVDDILGDDIDAEIQGGILTMSLDGGGQYVINKHGPNRQIWMSSPFSGASHYDFAEGQWISTRDSANRLPQVLADELKAKYGQDLNF
ncbi:iron donor protein CyaY [Magnetospirillum sulfuroxidans]|uniref:Iron-sulfur cluster assembly protein CyaY n=1 Tax=Magnetospirillum sulfuroxidans TaxID=611300 RepID=A0ABS5IB02_9PROT|nr:iron donor protein CyaY [Magnetospirillum sulfuroxidans]MBR9971565.1 iron donor protein CyaY [Magnetospirillum sulfuroxidans]